MQIVSKTIKGTDIDVTAEAWTLKGFVRVTVNATDSFYHISSVITLQADRPQVDIVDWIDGTLEREVHAIAKHALREVREEIYAAA